MLNKTLVIGAGSWGTALAIAIARNDKAVSLWGRNCQHREAMKTHRHNVDYIDNVPFPDTLEICDDLLKEARLCDHLLIAVPSVAFLSMLTFLKPVIANHQLISWATKGLIPDSGDMLDSAITKLLGQAQPRVVISGPSFAQEVASNLPTAMTIASNEERYSQQVAQLLHQPTLRAYTSSDMMGVQLGGALKNIMAIAAGIADGLVYGANTRAALITRGLAEIRRYATVMGAEMDTIMGLAGMGDLLLTCTDAQSRNRQLGVAIGQGLTVEQAIAKIGKTVEGMYAAKEVYQQAKLRRIDMPIVTEVYHVLYENRQPVDAVKHLLSRQAKPEKG